MLLRKLGCGRHKSAVLTEMGFSVRQSEFNSGPSHGGKLGRCFLFSASGPLMEHKERKGPQMESDLRKGCCK